MNFSNWLKSKLITRQLRQVDLCKALNIPRATVSNWIAGRHHPKHAHIVGLAEHLQTPEESNARLVFEMIVNIVLDTDNDCD